MMENNKKFSAAFVPALIFAVFSVFSCTDINSMLENYNTNYTSEIKAEKPTSGLAPGDEGFDEEDMLQGEYFVASVGTLVLYAPKNCASYKWSLKQQVEISVNSNIVYSEKSVSFALSNGSTDISRAFVMYIPDSGLETGTYKLSLTVTDKEGKSYTDTCSIVIYEKSQN